MNVVLMAYGRDGFREFILPNINDSDYLIILDQELFQMGKTLEVRLEVKEHRWFFRPDSQYSVGKGPVSYMGTALCNGDIVQVRTPEGQMISIVVIVSDRIFRPYRKYVLPDKPVTIGKRDGNTILYNAFNLVSGLHVTISRAAGGWKIEDQSANGTFVHSHKMARSILLPYGEQIQIFGLHVICLGNLIGIYSISGTELVRGLNEYTDDFTTMLPKPFQSSKEKQYYNRAPRIQQSLYTDTIEIEAPPASQKRKPKPLFMTIGPAFTMVVPMLLGCLMMIYSSGQSGRNGFYMYTGLITALASAIVGVVWSMVNLKYDKKEERENEQQRFQSYGNYLVHIADFLKEKQIENRKILEDRYPAAEVCIQNVGLNTKLWERNQQHEDFLYVRLGIGTIPFQAGIHIPPHKFSMTDDTLEQKPSQIYETYKNLSHAPLGIDLKENRLVGIVGGVGKHGTTELVEAMLAQIVTAVCYTDVKIAVVYDGSTEEVRERWEFIKWFPHVWSADQKTRYVSSDSLESSDMFYEIVDILRRRKEEAEQAGSREAAPKPHFILILDTTKYLSGEPIAKYIYDNKPEYGLSTLILVENKEELPNQCQVYLQNTPEQKGIVSFQEPGKTMGLDSFDFVSHRELDLLARRLSQIQVFESDNAADLPNTLDFFEMYGVSSLEQLHVLERWRKNRTFHSMKALIGKKAGGADCFLDIHEKYHGPHGLIAGTTGSGKSETLQTYMLSLALNFSPDDIGFFVIDFKGGGMANLFSDLPHLIGQISNLSGNQVHRAMVSIKSENKRRQKIFNDHGVNNINLYTKLLKNEEATVPVPHLFIIIDEFAELKREEPEFMKELISVAQVGRSLGVHLILATQKPSGTVDDNIWSNTKFRLCLRVQDRQDSNDMLHKPDAAYLTQAGRCYLQVGNDEIYELFQSGWSGAEYDEDALANQTNLAIMLTRNGKVAVVGNKMKMQRKRMAQIRWIRQLLTAMEEAFCEAVMIYEKNGFNDSALLEELPDEVLAILYSKLKQQEVEYPRSVYNTARLNDLYRLWKSEIPAEDSRVEPMDANRQEGKRNAIVRQIIHRAEEEKRKLPEQKEKTQLDVMVQYLGEMAKKAGYRKQIQLWLPVLPTELHLKELRGYQENGEEPGCWAKQEGKWSLETIVGLYDDPEHQDQQSLTIDFAANGHYAICGSVVSGKSTFLQTVLYSMIQRYSPEMVQFYILDFSSQLLASFEEAPHVGGIVNDREMDRIGKLFYILKALLEERKVLFRGGNYSQYVKANGVMVPAVVLVIDNVANFKEKTESQYEDILIELAREGAGFGMFLLLSSAGFGMAEIASRVADNIRSVIALDMGDRFKYADVLRRSNFDVLPEPGVKGRGLMEINGSVLEFQTALPVKAEDDYERGRMIEQLCQKMRANWSGKAAREIPYIPDKPEFSGFKSLTQYQERIETKDWIPYGYSAADASLTGISLEEQYCYLLSGRKRSGKSNLLRIIFWGAAAMGAEIVIIDPAKDGSINSNMIEQTNSRLLTEPLELEEYWKEFHTTFMERNQKKKKYRDQGLDGRALYEKMKEEKTICMLIPNLEAFVESVYDHTNKTVFVDNFLEVVIEKGICHNLYLVAAMETETAGNLAGNTLFRNYSNYGTGIHLGGNLTDQSVFDFTNIPYLEQTQSLKPGIGYTPSLEDENEGVKVVIPLVKEGD